MCDIKGHFSSSKIRYQGFMPWKQQERKSCDIHLLPLILSLFCLQQLYSKSKEQGTFLSALTLSSRNMTSICVKSFCIPSVFPFSWKNQRIISSSLDRLRGYRVTSVSPTFVSPSSASLEMRETISCINRIKENMGSRETSMVLTLLLFLSRSLHPSLHLYC